MSTTKAQLMRELNQMIARKLCEIEDLCHAYGLISISLLTCIARDPNNPDMTLVTTNDDLAEACRIAMHHTADVL